MDFTRLNQELLFRARELLPTWFPNGRFHGNEFQVGNIQGEPGESLSFNVEKGYGCDFATTEDFGDMISLYAAMRGIKQMEAARELTHDLGLDSLVTAKPALDRPAYTNGNPAPKPARIPICPVPEKAPRHPPSFSHPEHGKASHVWEYLDMEGRLLGYVARYETLKGKTFAPWTYAKAGWGMGSWIDPKP